jgi:hypothetical protein
LLKSFENHVVFILKIVLLKILYDPGIAAQVCNPSYLEGLEDCSLRIPWTKHSSDHISTNGWAWWHASVILATWESTNRRTMVQENLGIKLHPISKITNTKRAGGVV